MVETAKSRGLFDQYEIGLSGYSTTESMLVSGVQPMTYKQFCQLCQADQEYYANSSHPTFGKNEGASKCPKKGSF